MFIVWKWSGPRLLTCYYSAFWLPCFFASGLNPPQKLGIQVDNFAILSHQADPAKIRIKTKSTDDNMFVRRQRGELPGRVQACLPGHGDQHWRPDPQALSAPPLPKCLCIANIRQVLWSRRRKVWALILKSGIIFAMLQGPENNLHSWFWTKHNPRRSPASPGGAISSLWLEGWYSSKLVSLHYAAIL